MSVDKDVVSVMAAYLPVVRMCTAYYREALYKHEDWHVVLGWRQNLYTEIIIY